MIFAADHPPLSITPGEMPPFELPPLFLADEHREELQSCHDYFVTFRDRHLAANAELARLQQSRETLIVKIADLEQRGELSEGSAMLLAGAREQSTALDRQIVEADAAAGPAYAPLASTLHDAARTYHLAHRQWFEVVERFACELLQPLGLNLAAARPIVRATPFHRAFTSHFILSPKDWSSISSNTARLNSVIEQLAHALAGRIGWAFNAPNPEHSCQ